MLFNEKILSMKHWEKRRKYKKHSVALKCITLTANNDTRELIYANKKCSKILYELFKSTKFCL